MPNIDYVISYSAGSSTVNVNEIVEGNETADSGTYADVMVTDLNRPPHGYISISPYSLDIELTQSTRINISAYDYNPDTLTLIDIKVDGTSVTLDNNYTSLRTGYYYSYGDLNVTSFTSGEHTVTAHISDGTDTTELSSVFELTGNRTPVIADILNAHKTDGTDEFAEVIESYNIEQNGSIIKNDIYSFSINTFDPDGDPLTVTMLLDGSNYEPDSNVNTVNVTAGVHTMSVSAIDDHNNSASKTFTFTAGNQKPVINSAGISANPVNLHTNEMMAIYAWAEDLDGDGISSVIATDTNTSTTYTLPHVSGTYYYLEVNASSIGVVDDRLFTIVATKSYSDLLGI